MWVLLVRTAKGSALRAVPVVFLKVTSSIQRRRRVLDLLVQSAERTLERVAVLDHERPLGTEHAKSLSQTVLFSGNLVRDLGQLPSQVVQLSHLGVNVELCIIVAVRLGLMGRVNTGHGGGSFNVRDPHGGDLLETQSQADLLDSLAIDRLDIEVQQLFLGFPVPSHAGEVPAGIDGTAVVDVERTSAGFGEALVVDGNVSVTASILRLVDIESENQVLGHGVLCFGEVKGNEGTRDRIYKLVG